MLRRDQKSGSYVIEDLGPAARAEAADAATTEAPAASANGRARPSGRPPRTPKRTAVAPAATARPRRPRSAQRRSGAGRSPAPEGGRPAADDGDDDGETTATTWPASDAHPGRCPRSSSRETPAAAPAERPGFSLFSWLRKDGEEKKP